MEEVYLIRFQLHTPPIYVWTLKCKFNFINTLAVPTQRCPGLVTVPFILFFFLSLSITKQFSVFLDNARVKSALEFPQNGGAFNNIAPSLPFPPRTINLKTGKAITTKAVFETNLQKKKLRKCLIASPES